MKIPYRTRVTLSRVGLVVGTVAAFAALAWFCWVVWLGRYVVYGRDGQATLDFDLPEQAQTGEIASPPAADANVSIYYNEGADAVDNTGTLTQLNGYYITYEDLSKNLDSLTDQLNNVPAGTAVMIELKGGYGSFYYSSNLADSISSASVNVAAVDELITSMKSRGFYLIARVSAFRDYNYGLNHVPSGLPLLHKPYLWMDDGGCYWLNPTDSGTLGWVTQVVNELKEMGFHEVLLADFRFANSNDYRFSGDKTEALQTAAQTLLTSCGADNFTLSFLVTAPAFSLPEGRSRIYLENIDAKDVATTAAQCTLDTPESRLVFLGTTNDTRFDAYGVLRPLALAEVLEAQKADMAGN